MTLHRMVASFGCLNNAELELSDGFNLMYARNESGKSTWCAFVRAMLYGINTRARGKKNSLGEKNRYQPWSGAPMEGLIECTHRGQRILLRRSSTHGVPMGHFSATDAKTGQPIPGMTAENVGELLTGVDRDVFERSVFIQNGSLSVEQSRPLEQRIAALISSGREERSWSEAESSLRQWQRARRGKNGGLHPLEDQVSDLHRQLDQLSDLHQEQVLLQEHLEREENALRLQRARDQSASRSQEQEMQTSWAQAAAELDAAQLQLQTLEEQEQDLEEESIYGLEGDIVTLENDIRARGQGILLFSLLGLVLAAFLTVSSFVPMLDINFSPSALVAAIALTGLLVLVGNLLRGRMNRRDYQDIDTLQEEISQRRSILEVRDIEWESAIAREKAARQLFDLLNRQVGGQSAPTGEMRNLEQRIAQTRQQLALLTGRLQELGDPLELESALAQARASQERMQQENAAIDLALVCLADAERELRARFSPKLNGRTARYFSKMTDGAYKKVNLDRDFAATAEPKGSLALRQADALSRGALDQLYLSLRLAIADLLLPDPKSCPLILDDALVSFDEARCAKALSLLQELAEHRQVLLFSCHRRESLLLAEDPTVHRQNLTKHGGG